MQSVHTDLQLVKLYFESDQRKMAKAICVVKTHHVFTKGRKNITVWKGQLKLNTAKKCHPEKQHDNQSLSSHQFLEWKAFNGLKLTAAFSVLMCGIISHRTLVWMISSESINGYALCCTHDCNFLFQTWPLGMPYCIHPILLDFLRNFYMTYSLMDAQSFCCCFSVFLFFFPILGKYQLIET